MGASSYAWWWAARASPLHACLAVKATAVSAYEGRMSSWDRIGASAALGSTRAQNARSACSSAYRISSADVRGHRPRVWGTAVLSRRSVSASSASGVTAAASGSAS